MRIRDDLPVIDVCSNTSPAAGGAFSHGDWYYCYCVLDRSQLSNVHVELKELGIVREAAL
jgi:hypothetical protein